MDSGSGWTDYTFSAQVKSVDNDQLGISFRVQDANNYYFLSQNFGDSGHGGYWNLRLQKVVGGTETDLGSSPIDNNGQVNSTSTWYTLKVELTGNNIKAYVDDVLKFDITDSTYSTGTVGLWLESQTGTEFDDVLVQSAGGYSLEVVPLELTLSSPEGGDVTMRTKVYMRNVPPT